MTIQRRLAALLCLCQFSCLFSAAFAQPVGKEPSDTLQDYRYRMEVNPGGQQGAYRLPLPQAVYLHARSANLDDVRLFDASGAKIAYARLLPVAPTSARRASLPVKIFPVYARNNINNNINPNNAGMELDIQTGADGSLISVKTRSGEQKSGDKLQSLVLDLQSVLPAKADERTLIDALRFVLPAGQTSYSAQIWMEASEDLQHWEAVGTAELNWLINGEAQTLASDRLEFEARHMRYARISWRKGEPLAFAAINAETVLPVAAAPVMETLLIAPVPGKDAKDWVYPGAPGIPVERISLQLNEANVVYPAALGYYEELPAKQVGQALVWRFQALTQATFYRITQDGKLRSSGEITLPSITHQKEWVLRSPQAASIKPALQLHWQAASLVFVASGKPPYTLAFGREKAAAGAQDLAQVAPGFDMDELQKLALAKTGPLEQQSTSNGDGASEAALASAAAQKRTLVLWGVLVLGVAVLGAMAWSLLKQMKQKP